MIVSDFLFFSLYFTKRTQVGTNQFIVSYNFQQQTWAKKKYLQNFDWKNSLFKIDLNSDLNQTAKENEKRKFNVKRTEKGDKLLIFVVVVVIVCGNLIVSSQSINFEMEQI